MCFVLVDLFSFAWFILVYVGASLDHALSYVLAYGMLSLLDILLDPSCLSSIMLECLESIDLPYSFLKCDFWCMF